MEKNATIAEMKTLHKSKQEALGQGKMSKFETWCENKVFPAFKKVGAVSQKALTNMPALNWGAVLVIVILAYMAQNGMLDNMPNLKWLLESTVRLIEWCFGLFRSFFKWIVGVFDSKLVEVVDIFGIFEIFTNWLKEMLAL